MNITDTGQVCRQLVSTALTVALASFAATVAGGEINTGYFGNIAIKGYDPVAYFTMKSAVRGSEQYSVDWLGAEWHFANDEHRQLFVASPVRYAPQYGGHCADGVAYGERTTNIDPEAWRIIGDKLYLNYDPGSAAELEDVPGQVEKSVANWPKVKAQITTQ